jgi:hypothetical protein
MQRVDRARVQRLRQPRLVELVERADQAGRLLRFRAGRVRAAARVGAAHVTPST